MNSLLRTLPELLNLSAWVLTWFLGGYLIVVLAFRVKRSEATLLGFGLGWVLQVWLSNWTGRFLAPPVAFWVAALIVLISGVVIGVLQKNWPTLREKFCFPWEYWLPFLLIAGVFLLIGRGLAVFDDYQNLPITSVLAAGAIPPEFVLNPGVRFDYHYLMLLQSAQWMRIADIFPWTALDVTRAILVGLSLIYVSLWARRITHNRFAGTLTALFVAFAGGTRWLMLYIPESLMLNISDAVNMIGSGKATAPTLAQALISYWAIEGSGPLEFPFAFGDSLFTIPVMAHGGTGMLGLTIALLIFLLFGRWKNWFGKLSISVLLAAMALVDEIWFVYVIFAIGLVLLFLMIRRRHVWGHPAWVALFFLVVIPGTLAIMQGGVLTGVSHSLIQRVIGTGAIETQGYFSIDFPVRWPPAFISAHLGRLFLTNPGQLAALIFEAGPILLVFPLLILWGKKAYRSENWLYVALPFAAVFSLLTVFIEYQGSAGISASARLTMFALNLCKLFAVPLLWYWLQKKKDWIRSATIGLAATTMVGGLVFFSVASTAVQKPVLSYYIELLDAAIAKDYWDRLEPEWMVFDSSPTRSVTLFARPVRSSETWYVPLPDWQFTMQNPDPYSLQRKGFGYVYLSQYDWDELSPANQRALEDSCVIQLKEVSDWTGDFRRLLDIRGCQ